MAKASLADQMMATEAAYGWTREQLLSRIRSGQIKLEMDGDGDRYLVLLPGCERDPDAPAPVEGMPWWNCIPTWLILLTFPLWFLPCIAYLVLQGLNPFSETDNERRARLGMDPVDDDAWSYAERERWQWTLGTGRYADDK